MSRLTDIYDTLKKDGVAVYFPMQHIGKCVSRYAVVAQGGENGIAGISSTFLRFDIMCYVPAAQYSSLQPFLDVVRASLKALYPMIIFDNTVTEPYLDEEKEAWMSSILYRNNRKS